VIVVTPPGAAYIGISQIIPPTTDPLTPPFDVPSCPGTPSDAVSTTLQYCEAQAQAVPPQGTDPTTYYLHFTLDNSAGAGSAELFNNHIPLDTLADSTLSITKTTPSLNVSRGQLVPYEITVRNALTDDLLNLTIVDRFPPGFHYVEGSARVIDATGTRPTEPTTSGRELLWTDVDVPGAGQITLQLVLAVGAGVTEGEYTNRAQVLGTPTGPALTGEAFATVRVVPDPTFDCTDVLGKVFDDKNRNGMQETGERGLAGVRLVTARGLVATTDSHGRFHITCAIVPREDRGSNFVLKLDDRTLPSGYRPSTESALVLRATRGKALKFNFGASIHRVVGLDIADAVFEPGSTEIRIQWQPRLQILLDELEKAPAVLRLSYLADVEDADLVERRVQAIRKQITESWEAKNSSYQLTIEPEVFWRLGGPPEKSAVREPSGR
jgi:uncharacterized repeat protein (TIGR01451 family)